MRGRRRSQALRGLCFAVGFVAVNCQGIQNICARSGYELGTCRQFDSIYPLSRGCKGFIQNCLTYRCLGRTDCASALKEGDVQIVPMDPVSMFAYHNSVPANSNQDIKIIVTESHSPQPGQPPLGLFAVAVVRAATCAANPGLMLADTRGWTSCHGEYGDLAGWVLPLNQLQTQGLVANKGSDVTQLDSFYGKLCAPSGVAGAGVCSACNVTSGCTMDDAYFGPSGVLQCLTDGDTRTIGFIDSFSLLAGGPGTPSGDLNAATFRILTRDGCQDISQYARAGYSLGSQLPQNALVTTLATLPAYVDGMRADFSAVAATNEFQWLFSLENNTGEYMFSQGTTGLANSSQDVTSYLGWLVPVLQSYVAIAVNPTAQGYVTPAPAGVNTTVISTSATTIVEAYFGGFGAGLLLCALVLLVFALIHRRRGHAAGKPVQSGVALPQFRAQMEALDLEPVASGPQRDHARSHRQASQERVVSGGVLDDHQTARLDLADS